MHIEFDLLGNARDSIERAIEQTAWGDVQHEPRRLKQAVQSVAHGIELLLKERLKRIHPCLIWEQVDKYPSLTARTVTTEGAILRLHNVGGIELSVHDTELLRSLRATRNAIEHYVWKTTKPEAEAIIGRALEFAFHFARTELAFEFMNYGEIKAGTYTSLISANVQLHKAVEARKKQTAVAPGAEPTICPICRAKAVDPVSRACRLCGHWEPDYSDEIPF